MHEVSMISSVIEMVEEISRENSLKKVNKIILQIGNLTCVENNALIFAFDAIKKDELIKDASLEIENVEGEELLLYRIEGE